MKIDIDVRRFYTQFSEGFFDGVDVVAEAMATATLTPAQGVPIKIHILPPSRYL